MFARRGSRRRRRRRWQQMRMRVQFKMAKEVFQT